jgi:hypothetical protein
VRGYTEITGVGFVGSCSDDVVNSVSCGVTPCHAGRDQGGFGRFSEESSGLMSALL